MRVFHLFVLIILLPLAGMAVPPPGTEQDNSADELKYIDNDTYINANRILMFVTNHGNFGRDLAGVFGNDYGTYYPYTTTDDIVSGLHDNSVLYCAGLWMGGKINDQIRVTVAEYDDEYVPGPMANGTFMPDNPAFKVYKLYADSLADNPNADYLNWPASQGAPVNPDGSPKMIGDQMLWMVYNDADPNQHQNDAGQTAPLGIEVQQTVWAVDQDGSIEIPGKFTLPVTHLGESSITVRTNVINSEALTGDTYAVTIDSVEGLGAVWNLIDVTTDVTLLSNQTDFSGGESSPVVDGFQVRVEFTEIGITNWEWSGAYRPITGVDWGGSGFFGGLGLGTEFFGSSITTVPPTMIEIRWTPDGAGQWAYCYRRDLGFDYYGYFPIQNFTVWDVTTEPARQLNFAFVEYYNPDDPSGQNVDGKWNPGEQVDQYGNPDPMGGREYFFVLNSEYSETPDPVYMQDRAVLNEYDNFDCLIAGWVSLRPGTDGKPDPSDIWQISANNVIPGTPDTFMIYSGAPTSNLTSGPDGMTIYMKYKMYNRSPDTVRDFYFSLWSDPDNGEFTNDLVGCDTLDNIGYCYNGTWDDAQFGIYSPAVGFKILEGLLTPSPGDVGDFDGTPMPGYKNLGLSAFNKYINGIDPDNYLQTYNFMQGLTRDGDPLPNGSKFAVPGDPVTGTGDLDTDPDDRRMMLTCGPVIFAPGDSQYVYLKLAVGQGPDRLTSITVLKDILNFPGYVPPTELMATIYPDPQYGFFLYAINPIMDTIFITRAGTDPVGDIDYSSLTINNTIEPVSAILLPSHPAFQGEVLAVVVPAEDFIMSYGLPWGVNDVTFSVEGNFTDETPLLLHGATRIIGHVAGDANGDGLVNVGDAVYLIKFVFSDGAAPVLDCIADANCDGRVDVADAVTLINFIFREGAPPREACCR